MSLSLKKKNVIVIEEKKCQRKMLKRSRFHRFFVFKLWHQFRVQTPPGVDFMKQFRPKSTDKT
jgi:hypothetical protein